MSSFPDFGDFQMYRTSFRGTCTNTGRPTTVNVYRSQNVNYIYIVVSNTSINIRGIYYKYCKATIVGFRFIDISKHPNVHLIHSRQRTGLVCPPR
ncbi:hypothetical protein FGO68_gene8751 [Halteria grandinella]|uniref:Uncharacterized protein n=1 Tax=Halteria grandinella TaxID=5974 RepID=A0A8J8N9T7_HALGN|nr:hypothetical protein FGO68_gene8751 [Halteria grandinella]